jgi:outer membrane immunogenic protein
MLVRADMAGTKSRFGRLIYLTAFGMIGSLGCASAADYTPILASGWSGAYVGVHGGYAWGGVSVTNTAQGVNHGPFEYSTSGAFGGATLGYNFQVNGLVAGIEADVGYLNLTGAGIVPSSDPQYHQDITLKGGLYGDITGRLGIASDRTLFYGKGGLVLFGGQANQVTTKPGYAPTPSGSFTGWTLGAGVEHKFTPRTSVKVEYLHFDFGTASGYQTSTIADPPTPVGTQFPHLHHATADSIKVGLNWRFGSP